MGQLKLTPVIKRTYEDLVALPDDGKHWELIDGELYVVPSPTWFHQKLSMRLAQLLTEQVEGARQGLVFIAPLDVKFSRFDVLEPDVLVVKPDRLGDQHVEGTPDLVVEVLSPSNRERDRKLKRDVYAKYGVPEYWLVDPDARTVEVLVLSGREYGQHAVFAGDAAVLSQQFPDVSVPLSKLFAPVR